MIIIRYAQDGQSVSDFDYKEWLNNVIDSIKNNENRTFVISTSIPVTAVRLAVCRGDIASEKIAFQYLDKFIFVNKYGALPDWPTGFADAEVALMEKILECATEKSRKRKGAEK